jgi:hypothetical protein
MLTWKRALMSDTWVLRDPSQPCKHTGNSGARMTGDPEWDSEWWGCRVCPGGKEIVLRRAEIWERDESKPSNEVWVEEYRRKMPVWVEVSDAD